MTWQFFLCVITAVGKIYQFEYYEAIVTDLSFVVGVGVFDDFQIGIQATKDDRNA